MAVVIDRLKESPDAAGDAAKGLASAAQAWVGAGKTVFSGGSSAAGTVAKGAANIGDAVAGKGVGLMNSALRFTGAALTRAPWLSAIVVAVVAFGPIRSWMHNRSQRKQLAQVRAMNDAVEARMGIPMDDTRARTAALAEGRRATSERIGGINPQGHFSEGMRQGPATTTSVPNLGN